MARWSRAPTGHGGEQGPVEGCCFRVRQSRPRPSREQFPGGFDVILTQSEDDVAKGQATIVGNTSIVEVGRRGRWLGVVGAFRTGNPAKPFDLVL